jgi:hypothetical protein
MKTQAKIKLPTLKGQYFRNIDAFEEIEFSSLPNYDNRGINRESKIDFDGWYLYIIGSNEFLHSGFPSFDISFMDSKRKEVISPIVFLDFNDEGIQKLRDQFGGELVGGKVLRNVSEETIMDIINSIPNPKPKSNAFKLKDISDDLLKIAMMPKETRVVGVLNLKLLVDDLDEDDVPKEQIDLLKSIVDDLTDEIKYPTKGETTNEKEIIATEQDLSGVSELDLELDLCALNDMLDNAFDVDNIDELNSLLDCEVQKEVTESKDMSYLEQDIFQKEKNLILDFKMDLGYSTSSLIGVVDEDIINRDIVDEVTGFVIPIRINRKEKVLYPFDNEQLQRWETWGLV